MWHDESEIEEWFNERKEALNKMLYEAATTEKISKVRIKYEKSFKHLLNDYEKAHLALMRRRRIRSRLKRPIYLISLWYKNIILRITVFKKRFEKWYQKKLVDIKYYIAMRK